jgi:arylsulfatase A-like enzyme
VLPCAALPAGCAPDERRPNVVVLMLDTARPDYLSAYGHPRPTTPFLETFAAEGARFDRAYSSSSWSLPAHASLFTGAPPRVHRGDQTNQVVSAALPLLTEELRALGFRTGCFSANTWMGPKTGLERGFETFQDLSSRIYRPHVRRLASDPRGQRAPPGEHHVVAPVVRWLEESRADPRPFFLFVNLIEPHMPYLPDAQALAPFAGGAEARWRAIQSFYPEGKPGVVSFRHYRRSEPLDADEWALLTAMYEGALRLTDELTEAIVRAVDALAPRAETLVFVVSDHGENLGDHGHFQHLFNLYDSNLKIALLARGPGFAAGRVEENVVQIADLHATILAAAGSRAAPRADTLDLRGPVPSGRVVTAELDVPRESLAMFPEDVRREGGMRVYERELLAAVGQRFKLIRSSDGSEELFDLAADPGERRPLARSEVEPASLAELEAALARLVAEVPAPLGAEARRAPDPDAEDALRALGYVGEEPEPEREPVNDPRPRNRKPEK